MKGKSRYSIDIVEVALDLIECLAEEGPAPQKASQLARQIGISHNRVFRLLKTLQARGYVESQPGMDGYQLGAGFVRVGEAARQAVSSLGPRAGVPTNGRSELPRHFWQARQQRPSDSGRSTRIGMPDQSSEERARFEAEAVGVVEAAREQGITLRLLGGVAFGLRCPRHAHLHLVLGRTYSDINFAGYRTQAAQIGSFFNSLGYRDDVEINLVYAGQRMIFYHPILTGVHVDVFLDRLDFCHHVSWVGRLETDLLTLPLAELVMEKLQIVEINEKDIIDTVILLLEYPLSDHDDHAINAAQLSRMCANDWGMWRTFTMNLDKIRRMAREYQELGTELQDQVAAKVAAIQTCINREPKSLAWKLRARVGDRVRWYQAVDEIG